MDRSAGLTAFEVVNTWPREELRRILYAYGEERYAPQIAAAIDRRRAAAPISTTLELVDVIKSAMPARALREMGFRLPDSQANFLFVTHPRIDGARLYQKCRERGILIRHFSDPAIAQYNRVTIGAEEEMETFLTMVRDILREEGL